MKAMMNKLAFGWLMAVGLCGTAWAAIDVNPKNEFLKALYAMYYNNEFKDEEWCYAEKNVHNYSNRIEEIAADTTKEPYQCETEIRLIIDGEACRNGQIICEWRKASDRLNSFFRSYKGTVDFLRGVDSDAAKAIVQKYDAIDFAACIAKLNEMEPGRYSASTEEEFEAYRSIISDEVSEAMGALTQMLDEFRFDGIEYYAWDADSNAVVKAASPANGVRLVTPNNISKLSESIEDVWLLAAGSNVFDVVDGGYVEIRSKTHLILADGSRTVFRQGVNLREDVNATLNVYGQERGTGRLQVGNTLYVNPQNAPSQLEVADVLCFHGGKVAIVSTGSSGINLEKCGSVNVNFYGGEITIRSPSSDGICAPFFVCASSAQLYFKGGKVKVLVDDRMRSDGYLISDNYGSAQLHFEGSEIEFLSGFGAGRVFPQGLENYIHIPDNMYMAFDGINGLDGQLCFAKFAEGKSLLSDLRMFGHTCCRLTKVKSVVGLPMEYEGGCVRRNGPNFVDDFLVKIGLGDAGDGRPHYASWVAFTADDLTDGAKAEFAYGLWRRLRDARLRGLPAIELTADMIGRIESFTDVAHHCLNCVDGPKWMTLPSDAKLLIYMEAIRDDSGRYFIVGADGLRKFGLAGDCEDGYSGFTESIYQAVDAYDPPSGSFGIGFVSDNLIGWESDFFINDALNFDAQFSCQDELKINKLSMAEIAEDTVRLEGGVLYYVTGEVRLDHGLSCDRVRHFDGCDYGWQFGLYKEEELNDDYHIVLREGAKLIIEPSLEGEAGLDVHGRLNIYSPDDQPGELTVSGGNGAPGIACLGGQVVIYGGKVTATGGNCAAGIGGGKNAGMGENPTGLTNGKVVVYGGTVTATGGNCAAGIGSGVICTGGINGCGPSVELFGGRLVAIGGKDAPGIGAGLVLNGSREHGTLKDELERMNIWAGADAASKQGTSIGDYAASRSRYFEASPKQVKVIMEPVEKTTRELRVNGLKVELDEFNSAFVDYGTSVACNYLPQTIFETPNLDGYENCSYSTVVPDFDAADFTVTAEQIKAEMASSKSIEEIVPPLVGTMKFHVDKLAGGKFRLVMDDELGLWDTEETWVWLATPDAGEDGEARWIYENLNDRYLLAYGEMCYWLSEGEEPEAPEYIYRFFEILNDYCPIEYRDKVQYGFFKGDVVDLPTGIDRVVVAKVTKDEQHGLRAVGGVSGLVEAEVGVAVENEALEYGLVEPLDFTVIRNQEGKFEVSFPPSVTLDPVSVRGDEYPVAIVWMVLNTNDYTKNERQLYPFGMCKEMSSFADQPPEYIDMERFIKSTRVSSSEWGVVKDLGQAIVLPENSGTLIIAKAAYSSDDSFGEEFGVLRIGGNTGLEVLAAGDGKELHNELFRVTPTSVRVLSAKSERPGGEWNGTAQVVYSLKNLDAAKTYELAVEILAAGQFAAKTNPVIDIADGVYTQEVKRTEFFGTGSTVEDREAQLTLKLIEK